MFSEKEINYIKSQRLARIDNVSNEQRPDVAPVGFEFDGQHFFIGGIRQTKHTSTVNVNLSSTSFYVDLTLFDVR